MWIRAARAALCLALVLAGAARAEPPLSAIDWLSDSVAEPGSAALPGPGDTVQGAAPEEISVTALGRPRLDAVGLLPPAVTGLPADSWGDSDIDELVRLIQAKRAPRLPATARLLYTLLLAELDPPKGSEHDGRLLLARLDTLLALGALDQAQALLERAGPTNAELFRRWFDVSLLTGHEDRACAAMRAAPDIAPTFPARIFCLARGGDWNAALLTLDTAKALGFVTEEEDALLIRFLDPELFEGEPPLPVPGHPSPLVFRMFEAIGEALPTTTLPLAFAQSDLRFTAGWKARIEAAERLARSGAIDENRLLGIYTERMPAASGGVWDRVEAVQAFDVAMLSGDPGAVARALPPAWAAMEEAGLEVPFAAFYGERLARLPLSDVARALAFRIGLLSDSYEAVAAAHEPATSQETFLAGLARGDVMGLEPPTPAAAALADAFAGAEPGPQLGALLDQGRLGEALLNAIAMIGTGAVGDLGDLTTGVALLRAVGLEDVARRAALQIVILEPRA